MPPPASQTRVRPASVACHGWGASRHGPCMLPAICPGPWWWNKLSPPSASSAAVMTYSCSAVRGAVGVCVAAGWRGCVSQKGTWGSSCAGHAATGPIVTAATADASAVRSDWPVLPEPRGISGEVPAGRRPSHRSAVRAVRFGTIRAVASPLLYRGGGVERGALLQRLRALPRQEGGRDRLREALRASALRVRAVRVLPAVLRGRPG